MRVLLLGGYRPMLKALKQGLEEEGWTVEAAAEGLAGQGTVPGSYDVIVLDLPHPRAPILSVVRDWRRLGLRTPVLALTAPAGLEESDSGLAAVADDLLTKPFALETLLARLRALAKPAPPAGTASPPRARRFALRRV